MVRHGLTWVKVICLWGAAMLPGLSSAQTSEWMSVAPDAHLFPTTSADCSISQMPSWIAYLTNRDAHLACLREPWSPAKVVPRTYIACRGWHTTSRCNAQYEEAECQAYQQARDESTLCTEKLNEIRRDEAAERRRLAEEQRLQDDLARQREREARQARDMSREALARGDVTGANRILDTFIDQQDPTQLSRDILSGSNNLRRILGLPQRPVDRLSGQITALSLDAYRDLTGNALSQLGDATGGGAFAIDDGAAAPDGADPLPRGGAFPDPGAALIQTENGFADIAANWDELSTFGQLASSASILVAMAAVAESDGRPIPPSLVDGTFAANVTALAEAAAGGRFRFGDEVDVYTARAQIFESQIVQQRVSSEPTAVFGTGNKLEPAPIGQIDQGFQPSAETPETAVVARNENHFLESCIQIEMRTIPESGYENEVFLVLTNTCPSPLSCTYDIEYEPSSAGMEKFGSNWPPEWRLESMSNIFTPYETRSLKDCINLSLKDTTTYGLPAGYNIEYPSSTYADLAGTAVTRSSMKCQRFECEMLPSLRGE